MAQGLVVAGDLRRSLRDWISRMMRPRRVRPSVSATDALNDEESTESRRASTIARRERRVRRRRYRVERDIRREGLGPGIEPEGLNVPQNLRFPIGSPGESNRDRLLPLFYASVA